MANLVDFLFYKTKSFEGSLVPTPIFFSSGSQVTLECIFQLFFTVLRKIDWNVQLCERNHGLVFLGWGRGGFFSLSEFSAVLDVSVLCCAACVRNGGNPSLSFLSFSFLFARRNKLRRYARMHSPSLDRPFRASSSLSVSSSAPPAPIHLRTEHINKRRKEPLETESQGAVLWLCKVVY